MKILILTDGKAGHENQSKAFALALGGEFDVVETHFRAKWAKALSYLFSWLNVSAVPLFANADELKRLVGGGYSVVIGTGSGTFYAAQAMARMVGGKCGVVLYPRGYRLGGFDCILAPAFDRPKPARNVIAIPANLVANDECFYARGVESFREHYARTVGKELAESPKAIAVIVGGPNKCSTMTADWMRKELDGVFSQRQEDEEVWVTTSRRTPTEVEKVIEDYPFAYRLLYSKDHFNPIPAFVKLSRVLYVTAESTGMLSEACTFGNAKVVALDNLYPGKHKFRRFVEDLRNAGYVDGNRKVDLREQFASARRMLEA